MIKGRMVIGGIIGAVILLGIVTDSSQDKDDGKLNIQCSCKPKFTSASIDPPRADEPYLLTCIYNGNLDAVKKTVAKSKLNESKVPDAVVWAVKCNQPEILSWLLDNGWSTNPNDYDSPLKIACEQSCSVLKTLLKKKAKLNESHEQQHWLSYYKQTPLHYAIRSCNPCMVKTALDYGLDADLGSSYFPPLMEAVYLMNKNPSKSELICRLLVKYDADPKRKAEVLIWNEKEKLNPAEYLVRNHVPASLSLLSFLIDHGADAKYTVNDLRAMVTSLDVMENTNPLLKKHPDIREELLRSYLLMICSVPETVSSTKYNEALLKAIKSADIDLNQPLPGQRDTPLALAKKNNNQKLCELLIRYGAKSPQ